MRRTSKSTFDYRITDRRGSTSHLNLKVLGLLLALGFSLPAAAAAAGATFVSDAFIGPGVGHFQYYGHWEHVRQLRDGRLFGTSSRTASLGAAATLSFVGTAVQLYGVRGPGGGHAIVVLDGQRMPDASFYAAHKTVRAVVFTSPTLPRALHRLTLAAVADARPGHRSSYVNISGAVYRR